MGSEQTQEPRVEKRRTLVGPWKNIAEFQKVYDGLFGATACLATRRHALSQIHVWSLRRSTLCPAAVLATSVVVEVQLKDSQQSDDMPATELQTLYANAFTRFFNYVSSIVQTHNMRTMYETAHLLGLQSFVVDLRHICAHGQVQPPLEVLRNTAEYCVRWLHDYYWSAQRMVMSDVDASRIRRKDKTEFDDSVSALFGIYDAALEAFLKGAHNLKTARRHLHGKRFTQLKEYCETHELPKLRGAFDVIVKDLMALVKREVAIKDLLEIYVEALLKMRYFFALAEKPLSDTMLESVIEATQSLFRMLALCGFLAELFHRLLEISESSVADNARRAGASFWATQLVAGFVAFRKCKQLYKEEADENPKYKDLDFSTLNFETTSERVRTVLIYAGVDKKRTIIFGDSFRRPWVWVFDRCFLERHIEVACEYTAPVLKSILPLIEPPLGGAELKAVIELIDTTFPQPETIVADGKSLDMDTNTIYTVDDLMRKTGGDNDCLELNGHQNAFADDNNTHFGVWTIVSDDATHDWPSCPLGRLPWE